jgi:hypothetical protein
VILGSLDFEVDADAEPSGGAWLYAAKIVGFERVPVIVWASFLILFWWGGQLVLNDRWNAAGEVSRGFGMLVPSLLISAGLTRVATWPVGRLFTALADADTEVEEVQHREGRVVSAEVTDRYGQVELPGVTPQLIHARLLPGEAALPRGTQVRVNSAQTDQGFYFVSAFPQPSHPEPYAH